MVPLLVVGTLLLLIVLVVYVGLPAFVRLTLKQPAQPQLIPFALDHASLPKEAALKFQTVTDQLRPAGFEPVTGLAIPNQPSNVRSIVLFLVNRRALDYGYATMMYSGDSEAANAEKPAAQPRGDFSVEFVSHFRYGVRLRTNNSNTDLRAVSPRGNQPPSQFPMVMNAGRLYRLHQGLVARSGMRDKVFRLDDEFHGDAVAAVATFMVEAFAEGVGPGYMYLSAADKTFRPTWKGAFLMTWKLMWPMTTIRRAAREREARRLLAELEGLRGGSTRQPDELREEFT
jgi:hypothetical protein